MLKTNVWFIDVYCGPELMVRFARREESSLCFVIIWLSNDSLDSLDETMNQRMKSVIGKGIVLSPEVILVWWYDEDNNF